MKTTTVRVSQAVHSKLQGLAAETGETLQQVIEHALDAYQRDRFFVALDAAYEELWNDPVAREEELEERRLWDSTLADGLRDE